MRALVAALLVAFLLTGCEGADADDGTDVEQVDIDKQPWVKATVDSYHQGFPVVSYGGEFRAKLGYARITTEGCSSGYQKMIQGARDLMPVGTKLWVVRAEPEEISSEWISSDEVVSTVDSFVFLDEGERGVPTSDLDQKATINELLVEATLAVPDPAALQALLSGKPIAFSHFREMSPHDLGYWVRFQKALEHNWETRFAAVGRCRASHEQHVAEEARIKAEIEEEDRRWRRHQRWLRNHPPVYGTRDCDGDGDGICHE